MLQRSKKHAPDSLEKMVENLVKTWEMEASHKRDPKTWDTIDYDNWYINANNGKPCSPEENAEIGNYNCMMRDCPKYPNGMSWEETHEYFRNHFKTGFGWEVLEVMSGPPHVAFTWRHW